MRMTPTSFILLILTCPIFSFFLGYRASHRQPSQPNRAAPLPVINEVLETTEPQPAELANTEARQDSLYIPIHFVRDGENEIDLPELVRQKRHLSPQEWSSFRSQCLDALRPYAAQDYRAALTRWEDPGGRVRLRLINLWNSDHTGQLLREAINDTPDPLATYQIVADVNLARNWVATADFYSKIDRISSPDHSLLLDTMVGRWIADEGTAIARIWLKEHSGDPAYDLARQTVYIADPGNSAELLSGMSSPGEAEVAIKLGAALSPP